MSRRLFAALALSSAVASSLTARAIAAPAPASPPPTATATATATAPAFPTPTPSAPPRGVASTAPRGAATAPAATPKPVKTAAATPAPAPVPLRTLAPKLGAAATSGFTYLRDRYRRDDQGAALQKPIAQLAGLDYLVGTWSAHIYTLTARHKITRDFGKTTYVFARTMNRRWILGTDAKNTEYLYFTFDPLAQHWVYADIKGFPSYGISYSTGKPRHLVFEAVVESALGEERRLRTTLTSVDAKHFSLLDEEATPSDDYTPVVEFDFTRQ